jgi:hypothetical protein
MGSHPDLLEREIREELLVANRNDYKHHCLLYAQRILRNLRNAGQFAGLPTFAQFEHIRILRPRRARYEMMMYDRFRNFDVVSRFGGDVDIAREIGILLAEYLMGIIYLTLKQHELELWTKTRKKSCDRCVKQTVISWRNSIEVREPSFQNLVR